MARTLKQTLRAALQRLGRIATADLAERLDGLDGRVSPMPISRAVIAAHYLRGSGIEIGALHNPLRVPPGVRVRYVDAAPIEELTRRFPDLRGIRAPDIVDDGEHLRTIADGSCDFVIANHFFEHTEDPFATLRNFVRVLRPGGHVFMAIPDKRWTFDRDREVTTLDHLLRDHREGPEVSRRAHYQDWLTKIDGIRDDTLAERTEAFVRDRVNIHFHVWTIREMSELFIAARDIVGLPLEVKLCFADPAGLEVVWVLEVEG
jgi:SAM-dependent methyltransferase